MPQNFWAMVKAVLKSVGIAVPDQVVTNAYFNALLNEDVDSWLKVNVEIYERRWCEDHESVADLCERAALQCLERAGIRVEDLGLLIVATDTPEFISPSTASVVQHRIGAVNAGTMDINSACAGFVSALQMASYSLMGSPSLKYALVIGGYAMSKFLNKQDKKTVTLFADGAGAVILSAEEGSTVGFQQGKMITLGQYHEWMGIYSGGTRYPVSHQAIEQGDHLLRFVKKFPKELNPDWWEKMILDMCHNASIDPDEIDLFCFTQINVHSIRETMKRLNQPMEKAPTVMHKLGYTGSACIPLALDSVLEQGKLPPNKKIIFIGSGGGLSFSTALFYT